MFRLEKTSGGARLGEITTVHGKIKTPLFMNVATSAAIKGGISSADLETVNCQTALCNAYHLRLRPGDSLIKELGGLHQFMNWHKPILTDSGGFQVFSLAKLRKIKEEGVYFSSHIDGAPIFMGPEQSIQIQSNLGSTIAMAFDECVSNPAEYGYVKKSCEMTTRWLVRSKNELERLSRLENTVNRQQKLFAINQGGTYPDLRTDHMKRIAEMDLDGYAIGGLAVGETAQEMYDIIESVQPYMPENKPRYLMGVGTPVNIIQAVSRGIDMFDCVMPSRNGRHSTIFTWDGVMQLKNERYKTDTRPIDENCGCPACRNYSRAYIRHLFKVGEMLSGRLAVLHNLYFYNKLMEKIRETIGNDSFESFAREMIPVLGRRK
ncbi:MAG: tRNA guanosine(34) transglycosylase Tgt [Oscillospiraceae bacterium]|jgi:queuine tRNA-ribosyltransferase|nr:tRNA guanosine(34) transglycosylase Tgt [Oscillospiraceae bacterium]